MLEGTDVLGYLIESQGDLGLGAYLTGQGQAFLIQRQRLRVIAPIIRRASEPVECSRASQRRQVCLAHRRLQPAVYLARLPVPHGIPEAPQGDGDARTAGPVAIGLESPRERCAQVILFR